MSGNAPTGSPAPLLNGGPPVFVEHDRDPREDPGLDLPPFSVCAVGADYYRKCGVLPTDWDGPPCAVDCDFALTESNGGTFDLDDSNDWFPSPPPAAFIATFEQAIDPATVDGATVLVTSTEEPDPSAPYTLSVFGNTITVTPEGDPFEDTLNVTWTFNFTDGIRSLSGCTLTPVSPTIETVFDD